MTTEGASAAPPPPPPAPEEKEAAAPATPAAPAAPPAAPPASEDMEEAEEVDDEEALLMAMEAERAKEEAAHANDERPKSASAAPRLLQGALSEGQGAFGDGGAAQPEEQAGPKDGGAAKAPPKAPKAKEEEEEKKGEEEDAAAASASAPPPPKSARANQLDFLLSKASEYSSFIANDLEELQEQMTQQAAVEASGQGSGKKSKKRKSKGGESSKKKSKKGDGTKALKSAQDKHAAQKANTGGSRPIFIQPKNLSDGCVLKDYQLEGVRWLTSLYENGVSGILADEMGLGKTIQVIAMVAHLRTMGVPGPYLVVAPLATLPNWVREFEKWLPSLPVIRYHGTGPERDAMLAGPLLARNKKQPDFPVIITSYEMSIKDQKKLDKIGEFTYLVVDEGQRLKNHRCTLIGSLKRIRAANRLLLSGTPIQNNLDELWSLLNFVNPVIFDDLSVFQSWFGFRDIGQKSTTATDEEAIVLEEKKNQTVSKLHEILRPFLLRRIKRDVLTDMPPKKEVVVYAGMSKLQAGYADLIEQGVLRDILMKQGIDQARTLSQTNKMMNNRKNANHPFLFGEPIDPATGVHLGTAHPQLLIRASGKFALLDRMLERLFHDKHQVLIFSQMTQLLNIIEDYLRLRSWNYCRIDGSTKIDERQQQMDAFNSEKTAGAGGARNDSDDRRFVFLLSTRAGGLGINLATADTCIIFDSDWNPHQDSQAMDRCHRIGQNRPVAVYRLLTANSADIEMMEKQISKKKLERMAIVGGDFRKAGSRSKGEFSSRNLDALLVDDIKDLDAKGGDIESIKIDEAEFESIMDRERLFREGPDAIPTEGKMYDIVNSAQGDVLGAMAD